MKRQHRNALLLLYYTCLEKNVYYFDQCGYYDKTDLALTVVKARKQKQTFLLTVSYTLKPS